MNKKYVQGSFFTTYCRKATTYIKGVYTNEKISILKNVSRIAKETKRKMRKGRGRMMKNVKKIFGGILFLAAAVAVIAGAMGFMEGFSIWTVVFTIAIISMFVDGIVKRSFGNMLFAVAFLLILYSRQLGLEAITPLPVLGAALFGTMGLNMLFPDFKSKE